MEGSKLCAIADFDFCENGELLSPFIAIKYN